MVNNASAYADTPIAGYQRIGIVLGPAVFALMMFFSEHQTLMPALAWKVASVGLWMAIWWATEALPVAATAFVPLVTFDLIGIAPIKEVAISYAHPIIYLFLGAFILALAVEKWSLHRRIALSLLSHTGTDGRRLIFGFMVVAALLSMWMTNTSTTMMLMPIAASVAALVAEQCVGVDERGRREFQSALMLGLAYSTTIGGLSTLVGTPPNILLAGFLEENYGTSISFTDWMMIGVPLAIVLLPLGWWVITALAFRVNIPASETTHQLILDMRAELGPIKPAERRVAFIFAFVILGWMTRGMLIEAFGLTGLSDSGIAMSAALFLFVMPSGQGSNGPLLVWADVARLPWGVLILFGGGLSLAAQVSASGLAQWLGESLMPVAAFGTFALVLSTTALVVFLTELTSNLATASTFLPVIAAIAAYSGIDPLVLCVPVTLAASCAFMLPVATPPNAIVYASGMLRIPDMVRAGFIMNIIAMLLLTCAAVWLTPVVLGG